MKRSMALALLVLLAPAVLAADIPALYKSKCFACHGEKGAGSPMGKKMGARPLGSAEVQAQTDAQLLAILKSGKNKMPGYDGKIAAADLKALVAHIRTFK